MNKRERFGTYFLGVAIGLVLVGLVLQARSCGARPPAPVAKP